MKKVLLIPVLLAMVAGLAAQETTVSIMVKEGGKIVKDTTYVYENAEEAGMAVKILDLVLESHDDEDSFVWKEHGDHDCKHVKVMKVHMDEG